MDSQVANKACRLSSDAYHSSESVLTIRKGTAKVILVRENGFTWIAVEGTKPKLWDWIKNLWTAQTLFHGLQVHSGCAHEARILLPLIEAQLLPTDILRLTGHSQGGGVAPLLAWALASRYQIDSGYCFAPMRSVSKGSTELFNDVLGDRWFNFARQSDIVPHVPPALRYRRPGIDYFFNEKREWVRGIPKVCGYLYEVWRLARRGKLPEMWADHDINKYLAAMARL